MLPYAISYGHTAGDLQGIKCRLRQVAPQSLVIEQFMGPAQLAAEVYAKARLNIHPATYDAFGMTIVEAASQVRGRCWLLGSCPQCQYTMYESVALNEAAAAYTDTHYDTHPGWNGVQHAAKCLLVSPIESMI
jgi:hypothetical protein